METFKALLDEAVTPFHTARALAARLENLGFSRRSGVFSEAKKFYVGRGGTSILTVKVPERVSQRSTFRVAVAHTDFPGLALAPNADKRDAAGHLLHPEVYGSPILASWLDRDLSVAGMLVTKALKPQIFRDDALCRIPNLAIHLTRGKAAQDFNPQTGLDALASFEEPFAKHLERFSGGEEVLSYDARFYDLEPARFSKDGTLVASGRLDNLLSCEAILRALEGETPEEHFEVACFFDHEEIGSKTREGAAGNFLEAGLRALHEAYLGKFSSFPATLSRSFMLSLDAAHAVHPGHLDAHDPNHMPELGKGPVLKVNAQKRYASDVFSEAFIEAVAGDAGVPLQKFVARNDMPCGSTVGPTLSAKLGMPAADLGAAILSMHSIRETAHFADLLHLAKLAKAAFTSHREYQFA